MKSSGKSSCLFLLVEDVLVLAYGPRVRYVYLVHLTSLVQPRPPAAVYELIKVKGVFLFIGLSRVLVVRVLLQIVFGRKERGQAPQLQNALIARHGSQLAGGHQLPAQPLGVLVVAFRRVIQRCMLMTTDPGDLVLDITCGSGTTAYVAEQWGRRWITCDTSRVAITLAKQRLMTATFDYYKLAHEEQGVSVLLLPNGCHRDTDLADRSS